MLSSGGQAALGNVRRALSLPAPCGPSAALVPGTSRLHKNEVSGAGWCGGVWVLLLLPPPAAKEPGSVLLSSAQWDEPAPGQGRELTPTDGFSASWASESG